MASDQPDETIRVPCVVDCNLYFGGYRISSLTAAIAPTALFSLGAAALPFQKPGHKVFPSSRSRPSEKRKPPFRSTLNRNRPFTCISPLNSISYRNNRSTDNIFEHRLPVRAKFNSHIYMYLQEISNSGRWHDSCSGRYHRFANQPN